MENNSQGDIGKDKVIDYLGMQHKYIVEKLILVEYTEAPAVHKIDVADSKTGEIKSARKFKTEYRYDFNNDGLVDIYDLILLSRKISKL